MQAQQLDWVTTPSAKASDALSAKADRGMFANVNEANYSMSNSGTIEHLPDGTQCWTLGIRADYATNIFAYISNIELSATDQLSVQSPDGSYYMLYEASDIGADHSLLTLPIKGDSMIVQVQSSQIDRVKFNIESVAVGFRDMPEHCKNSALKIGYAASGSCEMSVTCATDVDVIKQAVCRIVMYGTNGSYWGTGTMLNNTSGDGTPYLLTAAHVLDGELKKCAVQFNYESPLCQDIEPQAASTEQLQSTKILVRNDKRDVLLLLLDSKPSEQAMVYYAGWNATAALPDGALCCIHHPQADVRMYSETNTATSSVTYNSDTTNDGEQFDEKNHWKTNGWTIGVTEAGSSGSALFDADGLVVGALTGGLSQCRRQTLSDYYWMLEKNWEELAPYLDPLNTKQTKLNGAFVGNSQMYNTSYAATAEKDMQSEALSNSRGYVAGHNALRVSSISQYFNLSTEDVIIDGLYLSASKVMTQNKGKFSIALWEAQNDGSIGSLLTSDEFDNSQLAAGKQSYLPFSSKIETKGKFYVGVQLNYANAATDTLAFYYQEGSGALFSNGQWQTAKNIYSLASDVQLLIGVKYLGEKHGEVTDTNVVSSQIVLKKISQNNWKIEADDIVKVMVYDIFGRRILEHIDVGQNQCYVNLSNMARGAYVVRIITTKKEKKYKILNQ